MTAVGSGKLGKDGKRIALDVKKGDVVLFGKYAGSDVKVDGEDYKIVRENDTAFLVMENGNLQRAGETPESITMVAFDRYVRQGTDGQIVAIFIIVAAAAEAAVALALALNFFNRFDSIHVDRGADLKQ